ncbi:MAG: hypothetical protein R3E01_29785 [Pirellulaceae bacterium]|nr:hypothetical protein [Planctomycetales bacterium]
MMFPHAPHSHHVAYVGQIPTQHIPVDDAIVEQVDLWMDPELDELEARFAAFVTVDSRKQSDSRS